MENKVPGFFFSLMEVMITNKLITEYSS